MKIHEFVELSLIKIADHSRAPAHYRDQFLCKREVTSNVLAYREIYWL